MSKFHIVAIIALSLILCFVLWQSPTSILEDLRFDSAKAQPIYPDAFLINSKTTQYSEHGHISHITVSERVNYFEPNNAPAYSLLTRPRIWTYNTQQAVADIYEPMAEWQASSAFAKSTEKNQTIELKGNVLLKKQREQPLTIQTDTLYLKPDEKYAETHKPVTINDTSGITTSNGLKVSLDSNTIELLSKVRSRYEPQ